MTPPHEPRVHPRPLPFKLPFATGWLPSIWRSVSLWPARWPRRSWQRLAGARRPTRCTPPTTSPATSGRSAASSCSARSGRLLRSSSWPIWDSTRSASSAAPSLGWKMAFCERDLAIYVGAAAGRAALRATPRSAPSGFVRVRVLILPMALDGFTQLFGWRESTWELRVVDRPAVRAGQRLAGPAAPGRRIRAAPAARQYAPDAACDHHCRNPGPSCRRAGERRARRCSTGCAAWSASPSCCCCRC